jgi:diguanylate cyclase (GGDEF)-like protein
MFTLTGKKVIIIMDVFKGAKMFGADTARMAFFNIGIDMYAIMTVAVLCYSLFNDFEESYDLRMLRKIELHIIMILAADMAVWSLNGRKGLFMRILLYAVNIVYFILQQSIVVRWFCYAYYGIYGKNMEHRAYIIITLIPLSVMNIMIVSSPFTGWCFRMDAENMYKRGPGAIVLGFVALFYMLFISWLALRQRRCEQMIDRRKELLSIALFPVPPFLGGIAQMVSGGLSFTMPCLAVSVLLLYVNKCNREISQDFLTGLNNRGNLYRYMMSCVNADSIDKTSMLMLDVNCFKKINDNYGHDSGDRALAVTAGILKNTFRRSTAFIARYGGDEFAVVLTDTSERETRELCDRIRMEFDKLNGRNKFPFKLTVSIGYARARLNSGGRRTPSVQDGG